MEIGNLLHFGYRVIRLHLQSFCRIPLSLYVVLTNRCNNNCVYCNVCDLSQKDAFTTESLKSILSEMKSYGTERIQFTGGEPMMRSDLGELIAHAKKLGLFVGVSTNGYQVAERIGELKGVDIVFLSYDGPDKIHSRLRGQRNLEEVKSALAALKASGIRVWTTTVLTRWNADYLNDIVDFARRNRILANFNILEFTREPPYCLHPPLNDVRYLLLQGEARKEAFRKLIKLKLSGAPIGSSLGYLKSALEWPYDERITDSTSSKRYHCWAGRAWGHLDYNGKLYSCGWERLKGKPGVDVLREGFRSAWNNLESVKNCRSCSHACGVENNLIFSLNPSAILNAIGQLYKKNRVIL